MLISRIRAWSPKAAKTRRGGRSALPRNDLRPRRAQDRPRAGSLHYGRSGPHRPQSRRRTARNRTLLVPLQGRERSGRRGPHGISRYPPGHRRHNIHDRKTAATMTKAEIQLVRSLADKRSRTEHGLFVAEGHKFIGEPVHLRPARPQDIRPGRAFRGRRSRNRVFA